MPDTQTMADPIAERANDLYWNTDRTVDDILAELGMGRGTLYSSLRPQPAGLSCPECGEAMVFSNRTGRDAGNAACTACGAHADARSTADPAFGLERPVTDGWSEPAPLGRETAGGSGWSRWREDLAAVEPERVAMVGGAAALGVMVGAAAARAVRQML